ncbi:MAG: SHOCT domain-containing protein [Nitrososphaerales archaeon]
MFDSSSSSRTGRRRHGFLRWIFAGVFALLLLGLIFGVLAFAGVFGHVLATGPYYYRWPSLFFFPFGFLIFVFVLFFVFRIAFWGLGWGWRGRGYYRGRWASDGPYALEILNQRYARGEITKEQYDQMKNDILHRQ